MILKLVGKSGSGYSKYIVGPIRNVRGNLEGEGRCLNDVAEAYKCLTEHAVLESMETEKAALTAYMEDLTDTQRARFEKTIGGAEKRCGGCRRHWHRGVVLHLPVVGGRSNVSARYQFWTKKMWMKAKEKERRCHHCKLTAALLNDPILKTKVPSCGPDLGLLSSTPATADTAVTPPVSKQVRAGSSFFHVRSRIYGRYTCRFSSLIIPASSLQSYSLPPPLFSGCARPFIHVPFGGC